MPITCTTTACNVNTYCLLYLSALSLSYTTSTHRTFSLSPPLSLAQPAHTECDINASPLSLSFPPLSLSLSLSHNHTQNMTSTLTITLSPPLSLLPSPSHNHTQKVIYLSPPLSLLPSLSHNHTQNMTSTLTASPPTPRTWHQHFLSLPYLSHNHTQNVTSTDLLHLSSLSHTHHTQNMTLTLTTPPPPPHVQPPHRTWHHHSLSLPLLSLSRTQAPHTECAIKAYSPPPPPNHNTERDINTYCPPSPQPFLVGVYFQEHRQNPGKSQYLFRSHAGLSNPCDGQSWRVGSKNAVLWNDLENTHTHTPSVIGQETCEWTELSSSPSSPPDQHVQKSDHCKQQITDPSTAQKGATVESNINDGGSRLPAENLQVQFPWWLCAWCWCPQRRPPPPCRSCRSGRMWWWGPGWTRCGRAQS